MTKAEWDTASDPATMIHWLERQGYGEALWDFTIRCCRRIWDKLPGEAFRGLVRHAERMGTRDLDNALAVAHRSIKKLEGRLQRLADSEEESRLNREVGFGQMVLAFEQQDGASAARSISNDMLAWSHDADKERQLQADLLRQLVLDPSQPVDDRTN
jgi:hypothetical protein